MSRDQQLRKPFWLIDYKLREADFFLEKLRNASELNEARSYFSAFVSAGRSVSFAIQVCLADFPEFHGWWDQRRGRMKNDAIARYFVDARNDTIHKGLNPSAGSVPQPFGSF